MTILRDIKQRKLPNWLNFAPGYLVLTEFSATGGIRYEPTGQKTGKGVDTPTAQSLLRESKSIVNDAYYFVDKHCCKFPLGFFTDEVGLALIRKDLADAQKAARIFNGLAEQMKSERRVRVDFYPIPFEISDAGLAARVAGLLRERLEALKAALRAGDKKQFTAALDQARNIHKLLAEPQHGPVAAALADAKARRRELGQALAEGKPAKEAGAKLNLRSIDAAIAVLAEPHLAKE